MDEIGQEEYKRLVETALTKALAKVRTAAVKYRQPVYPYVEIENGRTWQTVYVDARIENNQCILTLHDSEQTYLPTSSVLPYKLAEICQYRPDRVSMALFSLQEIEQWLGRLTEHRLTDAKAILYEQQRYIKVLREYVESED